MTQIQPEMNGVVVITSSKCPASRAALEGISENVRKSVPVFVVDASAVPNEILIPYADAKARADTWTIRHRISLGTTLAAASTQHKAFLTTQFKFGSRVPHFAKIENGECVDHCTGFPNSKPWVRALYNEGELMDG
tara:strand:- start:89 stop:496 length:408 start_codon:yes stop_codon:yes gene_type:complete